MNSNISGLSKTYPYTYQYRDVYATIHPKLYLTDAVVPMMHYLHPRNRMWAPLPWISSSSFIIELTGKHGLPDLIKTSLYHRLDCISLGFSQPPCLILTRGYGAIECIHVLENPLSPSRPTGRKQFTSCQNFPLIILDTVATRMC
jgi:hypothetical protein